MSQGDHIRFFSDKYLIYHHGIDCGDGTVIHYYKKYHRIMRTSLEDFHEGREIEIVQQSTVFPPEEVVKRASSRLGDNTYHLIFNNCEHFATWCINGKPHSQQVEKFLSTLLRLIRFAWIKRKKRLNAS